MSVTVPEMDESECARSVRVDLVSMYVHTRTHELGIPGAQVCQGPGTPGPPGTPGFWVGSVGRRWRQRLPGRRLDLLGMRGAQLRQARGAPSPPSTCGSRKKNTASSVCAAHGPGPRSLSPLLAVFLFLCTGPLIAHAVADPALSQKTCHQPGMK